MFKIDEIVAVCYDGKMTRAVEGKILYTTPKGRKIGVQFKPWSNERAGFVQLYCHKGEDYYSGILEGIGENGIMRWLDSPGDYYAVYPLSTVKDQGYKVAPYDRPAHMEDLDEENRRL